MPDRYREFELSVGDVLRIGNQIITIIDIDGEDVSFRVDFEDAAESDVDLGYRSCVPGK